ncbi:MAG: hypothetical protein EXQ96_11145 [Alphaproteobacteria bacterium]|nr:hypothetical protein [Alphaproteobacteria bacterium]
MALTVRAIQTLIDLAENKMSEMVAFDRDDRKEIAVLKQCVEELHHLRSTPHRPLLPHRPRDITNV